MDTATEDLYFQKLEEFVQDEDKIVTIPSLSRSINISIHDSHNLLSKYVKDQRKLKPNELAVTYILTGTMKDKTRGVIFVKEDDLKEKRGLFNKIESEVLFSVQKCKKIDVNIISLVDDVTRDIESPLLGSIVGKNCVKRILKVKKLPSPPPSTIRGKSSFFMAKTQSSSSVEKSQPIETKSESKPKKDGIAGMLTKLSNTQAPKDKDSVQKPVISSSNKPKGGLSAFLSKGSSSNSIKSEKEIEMSKNVPSALEELMEVDFHEIDENSTEIKDQGVDSQKVTKNPEKKTKNKRQREKSEEKSTKKRKRIVERHDSESDDMFENDEEDVIEKSDDEPERPPSPVAKKPLAPKNKIRKAVDKTYMDEEGFIVTKTEYIYESAPEDEEVIPVKDDVKPKLEKKASASSENDVSPTKGAKSKKGKKNNVQNQPTLMNFFKKK